MVASGFVDGELDRRAFAGGIDVESAFFGGDHVASVGDHAVDFGVVVLGVVMKEEEAFDFGYEGEFDDVVDAAVAPAAVFGIFFTIVLGVHDEDVDSFDEFGDFAVFVAGVFEFGGVAAAAILGIVAVAEVRFVVRKESDGAAGSGEPVTDADAGMIGHAGGDLNVTDVKTGFFEFFDFYVGRDFFQSDGKEWAFHLARKNICEAVARAFIAENAQMILFFIDRKKKWEALDMVPMGVSEKQGDFHWGIVEFGEELAAERAQTGAAVENDDLVIGADFDAGSVAAVADGSWARSGDGAADAPEFEGRRSFAGGFTSGVLPSFGSSGARHDESFLRA